MDRSGVKRKIDLESSPQKDMKKSTKLSRDLIFDVYSEMLLCDAGAYVGGGGGMPACIGIGFVYVYGFDLAQDLYSYLFYEQGIDGGILCYRS